MEFASDGAQLRNVHVEEADRIAAELAACGLVASDLRQAADAVAQQTAVQQGPTQLRDRGLESMEAVIKRQRRVTPESNDHGFLLQ